MKTILPISILFLLANNAWGIDLQPGEIVAPQADKSFVQVSYVYNKYNGQYKDSIKQAGDFRYNTPQELVRVAHSFQLAEMPAIIYAQASHSKIDLKGDFSGYKEVSGIGDTSFLLAVWPYANRETNTFFGIGAYLTTPTGSYDNNRVFNLGENRFKYALQAGYQTPLMESIDLMAAIDGVVYGDNKSYGSNKQKLSQENLYTAQLGIRYKLNPEYHFGFNLYHTEGGNQEIDDISTNNGIVLNRYQFTVTRNFSSGRLTLQYGQDLDTRNGIKEESRSIIRYTIAF